MARTDTIEYIIELPDTFYVKQAEAIILSPQLNFSATDYLWVPDLYLDCSTCLSPIASIFESTAYVFSTKNSNGCLIEAATFLSLSASLENDVFIPNSFSPNGDGQNDYFSIYGKALKEIKQVNIFDRWGNLLIDQVNMSPENIWDGRFRGKQIPAGTYIYQIQIEFNDGETINFSGDLNLWR